MKGQRGKLVKHESGGQDMRQRIGKSLSYVIWQENCVCSLLKLVFSKQGVINIMQNLQELEECIHRVQFC
jgi:hypothetical protein